MKKEETITLTKSDIMYLIASAAGYAWNEASACRKGMVGWNNKEKEKEKLLEWAFNRSKITQS